MSTAALERAIRLHAERLRLLETQEWYSVYAGDPNGIVYGRKGVFCLDYQNWVLYANDSPDGGNSWVIVIPGISYTRQILWYIPTDPLAVGLDQSATVVYRGSDLTLVRWDLQVKASPLGTSLIMDVHHNDISLWVTTPANRPTIAIGGKSNTGTDFDTVVITDGDLLRVAIDQVGNTTAGSKATLILEGSVNNVISG